MDKIEGVLEVGLNEQSEVVINLDRDRTGHIVFSAEQARHLGNLLCDTAQEAEDGVPVGKRFLVITFWETDEEVRVSNRFEPGTRTEDAIRHAAKAIRGLMMLIEKIGKARGLSDRQIEQLLSGEPGGALLNSALKCPEGAEDCDDCGSDCPMDDDPEVPRDL